MAVGEIKERCRFFDGEHVKQRIRYSQSFLLVSLIVILILENDAKCSVHLFVFMFNAGSKFFINEQRKEQQIESRIIAQSQHLKTLTAEQKIQGLIKVG